MKYKDWLNEWLEYYVKPTAKIRTYCKYRCYTMSENAGNESQGSDIVFFIDLNAKNIEEQ